MRTNGANGTNGTNSANGVNTVQDYLDLYSDLTGKRQTWDSHWLSIRDYLAPFRGRWVSDGEAHNDGASKMGKIIDALPMRALRVAAAGMHGGLTSPSRPWFRLKLADEELNQVWSVREWLSSVQKIMYGAFARSNFYTAIHETYADLIPFGTACLYEEEDKDRDIRFRVFAPGEYACALGDKWTVDTIIREVWMTAAQVMATFDTGNISKTIQDYFKEPITRHKPVRIIHFCMPNSEHDADKSDTSAMPFRSVYMELETRDEATESELYLYEGGYRELPYFVPRWMVAGSDIYGIGAGMDVLPDVKRLHLLQKKIIMAVDKVIDPPMRVPSGYKERLRLMPGGINPVDALQGEPIKPLYQINFDVAAAEAKAERLQMAVREGLFNDMFLMILERPNMTATEVVERHEEKLMLLGPVIERQMNELLDPLIERTFNILVRKGKIPPAPSEIQGKDWSIEYVSLMAQAQKMVATQGINSLVGFMGTLAGLQPDVMDKVDTDLAIEAYADAVGVPASLIRSKERVDAMRDARAQEQAQAQAMAQAGAGAGIAKDLSSASMDNTNLLGQLAQGLMAGTEGGA